MGTSRRAVAVGTESIWNNLNTHHEQCHCRFVLLERVTVAGLLHSLDHRLVDAEGDGNTEQGEQQVGDHADDTEGCQRQQQQHGHTKHHARLLGVSPVDQIFHCGVEKERVKFTTKSTRETFGGNPLVSEIKSELRDSEMAGWLIEIGFLFFGVPRLWGQDSRLKRLLFHLPCSWVAHNGVLQPTPYTNICFSLSTFEVEQEAAV